MGSVEWNIFGIATCNEYDNSSDASSYKYSL